ncbi:MAG TPA: DUF3168 domain-containing protein [Sphingomonadales bacterium]|nr:DUF3168 domain-containing protein [Sphingomonadales bacterium]
MTGFAAEALQKGVYQLLTGNALLVSGVAGIHDQPDEKAALPMVVIGDATVADNSTKTHEGQAFTLTLHAWSEAAGRMEVKRVMGLVFDALQNASITLDGHALIQLHFDFAEDFRERLGPRTLYHGVMRFRALTQRL